MAEKKSVWLSYGEQQKSIVLDFGEKYRKFVSANKTEREFVASVIEKAEKNGFVSLDKLMEKGADVKAGDKIYSVHQNRLLTLFVIGENGFDNGMNIVGAHADCPRLDLKQNPLYEANDFAMLDTHYYGGIKKYQWVTMPLALHGVVYKKDGSSVNISIGEKEGEPCVGISDLLPHLGKDQAKKTMAEAIGGESLDITIGNIPLKDCEKDAVKANMLNILKEKYDITEEDFVSAELQAVPAGPARDFGLDNSMIMSYGHDDRICSFAAVEALFDIKQTPKNTCIALIVDKEEIGSYGATGMKSKFFENSVAEVMNLMNKFDYLKLRRSFTKSKMLSADVNAAYDPMFPDVLEKNNCAYMGKGVVFTKYTGSRGKSGSSDADPKFIAALRKTMDDNNVNWQTAELGKVDMGGGGTIAYILAETGMDVIDCGVALLSMHAPYEVASKADLFEAYACYKAFYENI